MYAQHQPSYASENCLSSIYELTIFSISFAIVLYACPTVCSASAEFHSLICVVLVLGGFCALPIRIWLMLAGYQGIRFIRQYVAECVVQPLADRLNGRPFRVGGAVWHE